MEILVRELIKNVDSVTTCYKSNHYELNNIALGIDMGNLNLSKNR